MTGTITADMDAARFAGDPMTLIDVSRHEQIRLFTAKSTIGAIACTTSTGATIVFDHVVTVRLFAGFAGILAMIEMPLIAILGAACRGGIGGRHSGGVFLTLWTRLSTFRNG